MTAEQEEATQALTLEQHVALAVERASKRGSRHTRSANDSHVVKVGAFFGVRL